MRWLHAAECRVSIDDRAWLESVNRHADALAMVINSNGRVSDIDRRMACVQIAFTLQLARLALVERE